MQVTEIRSEGLSREFQIIIPASDLDDRLTKHLESIKGTVQLKGFRPGKVPLSFLKKTYGKSMMGEIIQEAINEVSSKALEERELRPAQTPKIDFEGEMNTVITGKADLTFKMAVELMPEFETGDMSKLKLERPIAKVSDADVKTALERLAEQQQTFKPRAKTAKAKQGDQVTIDFVGRIDGEEFEGGKAESLPLVLGSGAFLPGFEEQLVDVNAGDDVTVKVAFPDKYPVAKLAGKPAEFAVTVKEVAAPEKAQIDDEMAKRLGVESLAKLKEALKSRIERDFAQASRERVKRNLLDALDDLYAFELPQRMVEAEFEQIWLQLKNDLESRNMTFEDEGQTEEETKAEYRGIAERRVKLGLVLAEVGRRNNIEVSQDELGRALAFEASRFPGEEKKLYDLYKANPQLLTRLRAPIFEDKVVDFVLELAAVTETEVSREDLFKSPEDEAAEPKKAKKARVKRKAPVKSKKAAK